MDQKLSVVLATRNEEQNLGNCLDSVKGIANEIIVVDEESEDKTREIAKKFGAKVYKVTHEEIFHKTKQKALDFATCDWILQLDADEVVTAKLADEIKSVVNRDNLEREKYQEDKVKNNPKYKLFRRHEEIIRKREVKLGKADEEIVAYFIPRKNYFLGKPLVHAGVYPDGVIRLFKNGFARFPSKSVHELLEIDGGVGWLINDLNHFDSPTFNRYLERANRYTDLTAREYEKTRIPKNYWNLFKYSFIIPFVKFISLYVAHKGFLDGMRGFIWSLFSALHFPIAYFKYWQIHKSEV